MDSFRGFEDDAYSDAAADDEPAMDAPPEIGVDERRMHVRAYNHWVSLLDGRPYPLIDDLDPAGIEDFGPHSVLLDFSGSAEDPEICFLGRALRVECALDSNIRRISQVPGRSLLSRLTDHYLQIIANCAPIGFEAEYVNRRGVNTLYRGILMPLSSDGEAIDFIYGVINWKELADSATASEIADEVDRAVALAPGLGDCPVWADGPNAEIAPEPAPEPVPEPVVAEDDSTLSLWPEQEEEAEAIDEPVAAEIGADAGLGDRLSVARQSAEAARSADHRSRGALYRALGHAYDFAIAADSEPEDYSELLEDAGLKAQERAPMTPVVKLVFGADYDKTRIAEFAAALSWAWREGVAQGGFADCLESRSGGLKAIVQAERKARRPEPKPDPIEAARERLRKAGPLGFLDLAVEGDGEFVLFVGRREPDGRVAIVAPVADRALTDRAIRKAA
ncbi:PAS domain-containing protein [Allosphingosinicella sp.]|jgi:hypothetical protein|uniref:PAS domain-containing protein n=1 Tax=Allosphingosinicella sp. TaxID=2823234 RepID=UPI002EDD02CE